MEIRPGLTGPRAEYARAMTQGSDGLGELPFVELAVAGEGYAESDSAPLGLIGAGDSTRSDPPVHRAGRHLPYIPGAGGDRFLQLGQPGQVTFQCLAAFFGEPEPRARPPADRALADLHVPGVFERDGLFRQHRVADPGRVTQRGQLDPVRASGQQPAAREAGDRMNERVRPGGHTASHATPPPSRSSWRIPRRMACWAVTSRSEE